MLDRRRVRRHERAAQIVLGLGLLQFVGYLGGLRVLQGIGAASGVAPLPKVFSAHKGVETFAWEMTVLYRLEGREERLVLTPERCASLRGPYNRRNVYGALLSYGPLLPDELRASVTRAALAPGGLLVRELGVPAAARDVRVELRSRSSGSSRVWILSEEACRELEPAGAQR